mmetsp:Transcript_27418/g.74395  ORF Transcript_27418/g.74395 Transcript_27418/m.74395 type:complete len:342 (+) Transcript_27418:992-2017(+)
MALFAGHVHAFEPMNFCIDALKSNRAVNPHLNITVHEVAMFSKDGPLPFSGQDAVNGGPAGFGGASANFNVNGVAAMPYLKRIMPHGFGDIGFIKIDTEGYDSHLLRLLQPLLDDPTLATKRPTIRIEWFGQFKRGPANQCTDGSRQLFDAIESVGYLPVDSNTGEPVPGCESRHYRADLTLISKKNPLRTTRLTTKELFARAQEMACERKGRTPTWLVHGLPEQVCALSKPSPPVAVQAAPVANSSSLRGNAAVVRASAAMSKPPIEGASQYQFFASSHLLVSVMVFAAVWYVIFFRRRKGLRANSTRVQGPKVIKIGGKANSGAQGGSQPRPNKKVPRR